MNDINNNDNLCSSFETFATFSLIQLSSTVFATTGGTRLIRKLLIRSSTLFEFPV